MVGKLLESYPSPLSIEGWSWSETDFIPLVVESTSAVITASISGSPPVIIAFTSVP